MRFPLWQKIAISCWLLFLAGFFIWKVLTYRERPFEETARSFCANAGEGGWGDRMESSVGPSSIAPSENYNSIIDSRMAFRITMGRLVDLYKNCQTVVDHREDHIAVVNLCGVFFVVSDRDWIWAIMDEATWRTRGSEILPEVRTEETVKRFCLTAKSRRPEDLMDFVGCSAIKPSRDFKGLVDLRASFRISFEALTDLAYDCQTSVVFNDTHFNVVGLCDVYFVMSNNRQICGIMDKSIWQERGEEILTSIDPHGQ